MGLWSQVLPDNKELQFKMPNLWVNPIYREEEKKQKAIFFIPIYAQDTTIEQNKCKCRYGQEIRLFCFLVRDDQTVHTIAGKKEKGGTADHQAPAHNTAYNW